MKKNAAVESRADATRSRLAEAAVELALGGRWSEAADVNRRLIEHAAEDVRARNRLGRALEALGRTAEAREAYSAALAVDPHDRIAARGLDRLEAAPEAASAAPPPAGPPPGAPTRQPGRPLDYGRLETRVEEPSELQEEYLEPYGEYEVEEPQRALADRIDLAGELLDETRLEELEGAIGPDLLDEEHQQEERDRDLAAEEESDRR